ncbi:MAG: SDR family oxidoreductase [Alphaproteobacteria bacterium]|nr:SDR family oxidoreductase [Alphaproteobacteria bacterium]
MSKTLLITGGSSPIGAAIIKKFVENGYNIFFTYNSRDIEANQLAADIKNMGKECIAFKQDMTDIHAASNIISNFEKHFDHLDILVNNAVIKPLRQPLISMLDEEIDNQIMVGLTNAIKLCKHASSIMKNGSSIINISSESAKFGGNKIAVYAALKGALNSFTIGYAREMAESGIRVNAISPAVIHESEDVIEDQTIPLGRKGKPSEVADLAFFLCSKSAAYISGSIHTISGAR